jgi:hypothetical protein
MVQLKSSTSQELTFPNGALASHPRGAWHQDGEGVHEQNGSSLQAMRSRDLLIGGSIASLIVLIAIGRSSDGIEGGTVFMLLLFGLLLVGIIVLNTNRKQESQSSTEGVLKHNEATLETNLTEAKENLKDPLDEGFDIPL